MTMQHSKLSRAGRFGLAGAAAVVAVGSLTAGAAAAAPGPSASVDQDTLTVTGTQNDDRITLLLAPGASGTLLIDFGDDGTADFDVDRSQFTKIEVLARGGNDQVRIDQVNGTFVDESIVFRGGEGDDAFTGGDGVEEYYTGPGNDSVDGNRGNDTAFLGAGDDSFRWDPGDGSDIVEGKSGFDTLDFNGASGRENMSLSAEGKRAVFLRDAGNIRMDMDEIERLDLTALGDVDTFTMGDLSGTDMRVADVDLSGPAGGGDGAADIVTMNGTPRGDQLDVTANAGRIDVEGLTADLRITGAESADQLNVNTLDGFDEVDVADGVAQLITLAIDLGAGQV